MSNDLERYRVRPDAEPVDIDLAQEVFALPDRRRLTEELAEQIGADVIARRRANLVPGRKSLSGDGRHSPTLQVRLPVELHEQVRRLAAERQVSVSGIARAAIEEYLAHVD